MYQSKSTPTLSFNYHDEPQFDQEDEKYNSEDSWDSTFSKANLQQMSPREHPQHKNYRQDGIRISNDSKFLRQSLEKKSDAFESILDNAMRRTVARREAREREKEYLLEVPPIRAQLQLRGLPRTKRELYSMVQKLRAIRAEHEQRIDELNRAIVLHRSTTRRQASRIAKLEKDLTEKDKKEKEIRGEIAAAKGRLWKMTTGTKMEEKKNKDFNQTKKEMIQSLKNQQQKIEERFKEQEINLKLDVERETKLQLSKQDARVEERIQEAVSSALLERDKLQIEKDIATKKEESNRKIEMEKKMSLAISEALRKQKEWMIKEEEKMMEGVQKTEAHLLADMKAAHLEAHAAELAASNASHDKLIAELRRELVALEERTRNEKMDIEKRYESKIKRLEATHEKEMNDIMQQQANIAMLKAQQKTLKKEVNDLQMENIMLKSQVVQLSLDGYGGDVYSDDGYSGDGIDDVIGGGIDGMREMRDEKK